MRDPFWLTRNGGGICGSAPGAIRWWAWALSEIVKTSGLWLTSTVGTPPTFSSRSPTNWPMASNRAQASYLWSSHLKDYSERPARQNVQPRTAQSDLVLTRFLRARGVCQNADLRRMEVGILDW